MNMYMGVAKNILFYLFLKNKKKISMKTSTKGNKVKKKKKYQVIQRNNEMEEGIIELP